MQCATGGQFMCGGMVNGSYHDVPSTPTWFQGASVTSATPRGTLVATGWQNGGYPSETPTQYQHDFPGSPINHVGVFEGFDSNGDMILYDQYSGKPLGNDPAYKDPSQWNEVNVAKSDGPYAEGPSQSYPGTPKITLSDWNAIFPGSLLGSFASSPPSDPNHSTAFGGNSLGPDLSAPSPDPQMALVKWK